MVAASDGLRWLGDSHAATGNRPAAGDASRRAFEEAMLHFARFSGRLDHNVYFMRLNTRLVDDIAAGRPPEPNPFATDHRAG
jgi:hypothetical protein